MTVTVRVTGRAVWAALPLLVVLLAVLLVPAPGYAQEADPCLVDSGEEVSQPVPAPVCGTTTIHAEGPVGMTLTVPQDTKVIDEDFTVDLLDDTSYAWVGLADTDPAACGRAVDPTFSDMCVTHSVYRLDTPHQKKWVLGLVSNEVNQGVAELYVLSDGPIRITLKFAGLSGAAQWRAGGTIQGVSQPLTPRCAPVPDCDHIGWGGATHTVAGSARVGAIAYAWNPSKWINYVPYPSTAGANACLYPRSGSSTASTDPDSHPHGCAYLRTEESDWLGNLSWFVSSSASATRIGVYSITENINPADGPVYAGFTAQQYSTAGGGDYVAYGFWLEEGIENEPEPATESSRLRVPRG